MTEITAGEALRHSQDTRSMLTDNAATLRTRVDHTEADVEDHRRTTATCLSNITSHLAKTEAIRQERLTMHDEKAKKTSRNITIAGLILAGLGAANLVKDWF